MDGGLVVVYVTAPRGRGEDIAGRLVESRLAACVNVVGGVRSIYWWEGEVQRDEEELLIIKTRRDLVERLIEEVKKIHPYSVPEVLALPVEAGNPDYIRWAVEEARGVGPG